MAEESVAVAPPAEPSCRNCGAPAPLAFCPVCGQETRTKPPTFLQFMREAGGRLVALDGRLWKTLVALLFRPGFLTREYFAGRRKRYVRPARLFLVASLLLFAALRIVVEIGEFDVVHIDPPAKSAAPAKEGKAKAPATEAARQVVRRMGRNGTGIWIAPIGRGRSTSRDNNPTVTLADLCNLHIRETPMQKPGREADLGPGARAPRAGPGHDASASVDRAGVSTMFVAGACIEPGDLINNSCR